jgi:hypothetical protein
MNLLTIARLRYKAVACGVTKITEISNGFLIYLKSVDLQQIAELAAIYRRNFLFSAATPPYITLKCENKEKDIEQFMGNLANLMDKSKKV